ncbi:MAG: flagellar motor protein [Desulfobaccales bacterium]
MDKSTIFGLLLASTALIGGHFLEGGSLGMILQITAMIIVFGGTIGAVFISFPRSQLRQAWQEFHQIFREPKDEAPAYLARIIEFAYRGRREGMLSLEKDLPKISDPFFRRGLQLVIDGHNHQKIQEVLEVELEHLDDNGQVPARVFETAGGYAPTIGILGAVLGLIHVMQNLTDPAKLGVGVAVAFVATVYGVASANLFFLPIGHKLRLRNEKRMLVKEMVMAGILGLAHGDHPRLIEEKLRGFLTEDSSQNLSGGGKVRNLQPRSSQKAQPHETAAHSTK